MIADLHIHYPMHVTPTIADGLSPVELRDYTRDRDRSLAMQWLSKYYNYRDSRSGPRATVARMLDGGVGVAFSVLYSAFDELEPGEWALGPPRDTYAAGLFRELASVEQEVSLAQSDKAVVVRSLGELNAAREGKKLALVHCVEGGFRLGATEEAVRATVAALAAKGVAYVTLAHLFFRGVAGNAPALPAFGPDCVVETMFPTPDVGLTELGAAAVEAMREHGVLIDVTHMNKRAIDDTFALLDKLDRSSNGPVTPVIASHAACRSVGGLRGLKYNLDDTTVKKIHERGGVVGLINCPHFITNGRRNRAIDWSRERLRRWGLRELARDRERSLELFCSHVQRVYELTGSFESMAVGSDLDGFVKPTLPGVETAGDLKHLEVFLRARLGHEVADKVCHGNVLRVLGGCWGRRVAGQGSIAQTAASPL